MKKLSPIFILLIALFAAVPVGAQGPAAHVFHNTVPVNDEIRAALDAWLPVNAPAPTPYYSITYVEPVSMTETIVSLAALPTNDLAWRFTDGVVWAGSVVVLNDGSVSYYNPEPVAHAPRLANLIEPAPGGGANIRFPWAAGSTMMYGRAAVHAGGYSTSYLAVDFVGGDDMGSGVAGPQVYAVAAGEINYICDDGTSVAIGMVDAVNNNNYIYAHLIDNGNLTMSNTFNQGALIGTLKYGTFDDTCGNADQQNNHYHLHFGFEPANNAFRMENCILNTSTEKWLCGTTTISTGQFLRGGGGAAQGVSQPSFWDYLVAGVVTVYDKAVVQNLPNHSAFQFTYVIYSTVKLTLKILFVLVYSNVNLGPLFTVIGIGLTFKALLATAEFVVFLLKAWKSLVPVFGA